MSLASQPPPPICSHPGRRRAQTLRPQLATFNVTNGLLSGLKTIKPVAWGWNVPGKNVRIENYYVNARPDNATRDSTVSFPFNTDGFNLSGQNITVDGYWGENGCAPPSCRKGRGVALTGSGVRTGTTASRS